MEQQSAGCSGETGRAAPMPPPLDTGPPRVTKEIFDPWRGGHRKAYDQACQRLWNWDRPVVSTILVLKWGIPRTRAEDAADEAFWLAMEETDLMVSFGLNLTWPQADGTAIGRVSSRHLGVRRALEWRGEEAFHAFFRRLWILRAVDCLHAAGPLMLPLQGLAEGGGATGIPEPAADPAAGPEAVTLARESIVAAVEALATAAEQSAAAPRRRIALLGTLLYLKWQVARSNPARSDLPPIQEASSEALEAVRVPPIEVLLAGADRSQFELDGAEWRAFLWERLFEPIETVPAEEKRRSALEWMADAPEGGKKPSQPHAVKIRARERMHAAPETDCGELRPEFEPMAKKVEEFGSDEKIMLLASVFAHVGSCAACQEALGEAVITKRNRDTLDQQVHRCRAVLKEGR